MGYNPPSYRSMACRYHITVHILSGMFCISTSLGEDVFLSPRKYFSVFFYSVFLLQLNVGTAVRTTTPHLTRGRPHSSVSPNTDHRRVIPFTLDLLNMASLSSLFVVMPLVIGRMFCCLAVRGAMAQQEAELDRNWAKSTARSDELEALIVANKDLVSAMC